MVVGTVFDDMVVVGWGGGFDFSSFSGLRSSGAPSRRACEVFSRALVLPTSRQVLPCFLMKRPPFCLTRCTMVCAMRGLSRRLEAMYKG